MKPTAIRIHLDTPNIHIYGEQRPDSAPTSSGRQVLLAGTVELQLRTAMRIRSLGLSFFGEQIIRVPSRNALAPHTNNKCLADIAHDPPLLQSSADNTEMYAAGTHWLPFQFILSEDLVTSAVLSFGHVRYAVRAQLVVSALRRTEYLAEEPVAVVRCPGEGSEWAFSAFDALSTGTHWEDRVLVTLSHDTCALGVDMDIRLRVDIAAMQKHFGLLALDAVLHETQCAFGSNEETSGDRSVISKKTRIVAHKRMAFGHSGDELGDSNSFVVELHTPQALNREGIQYTSASADLRVTHRLVLTALIRSPEGPIVEIALPSRVWVLPQTVIDRKDESELPLYQHTGNDQLVETAHNISAIETGPSVSVLPPYSLPVCLSCGKEDISVLDCQVAIFHRSRMPENADIEDLCTRQP